MDAQDIEVTRERERLFNFLKKYDLHQYHSKFLLKGVHRLTHLKAVLADEASLDEVGLSRIERVRLKKKVKENVAWKGKMMKKITGKEKQFDAPAPEMASVTSIDADKEGRRSATIIPKDEVKLVRKIGEGAHGSVHEGTWADIHGAVAVAVKTLYVRQDAEQFIKEANSMATLHHKHIIQLFGVVLAQPLMLVEELAPFGSLQGYIKKEGAHVTLPLLHTYACQIADAMAYLESRRLVHRDLAIRNILLAQVDFVKLSDFGMARALDENCEVYNLSNLTTRIPIAWTAPEAMMHAQFSSASDLWSYGVSLWEIYSLGNTPWKGLSPIEIRDLLVEGQRLGRPERCPADIFDMIQTCWKENPTKRPSFADILKMVKMLVPRQVRAIKPHVLGDDPNSLSFRTGDILYIIDKPSREWYSGMKMDGSIGHFRSDFVSELISPLDDIRAKVAAGKAVQDLTIGSPTHVDHMVHYYHDGSKWVSENANAFHDLTPPNSPTHVTKGRSTSDPSVSPLPFTVINTRSPSPKDPFNFNVTSPKSPLLSSTTTTGHSHEPLPYQVPISSLVRLESPSNTTRQQQEHQPVGRSESPPPPKGEPSLLAGRKLLLRDIGHNYDVITTPEADNQYVSIKRTSLISPIPNQPDQTADKRADSDNMDAYITMQSWSVSQQSRPKSAEDASSRAKNGRSGSERRNSQVDSSRSRSVSSSVGDSMHKDPHQRSQTMVGHSYMNYPVSNGGNAMEQDQVPSDGTYDELRLKSTQHYQVPRSAPPPENSNTVTLTDASLLNTSNQSLLDTSNQSLDTSNQPLVAASNQSFRRHSLLDTSNHPTSPGSDLPTPLIPVSTPSPTKERKLSNSHTLPSRSTRRDSGPSPLYRVPIDIREDDVFLKNWEEEEEEAVVPQLTRCLYPSTSETLGNGSAQPPIPRPRTGLASAERVGGVLRESSLQELPPVPTKRTMSERAGHLPQVAQRRHIMSHSNAADMANDYQSLIQETLSSTVPSEYVELDPNAVLRNSGGRGQGNSSGRGVNTVNRSGDGVKRREQVPTSNTQFESVRMDSGRMGGAVSPQAALEEILKDEEFTGCEVEICRFALEQLNFDLERAKAEIRVQMLLSMLLPYIREEDCRRALVHCQQKTNRAAAWLIQRSEELERRAH